MKDLGQVICLLARLLCGCKIEREDRKKNIVDLYELHGRQTNTLFKKFIYLNSIKIWPIFPVDVNKLTNKETNENIIKSVLQLFSQAPGANIGLICISLSMRMLLLLVARLAFNSHILSLDDMSLNLLDKSVAFNRSDNGLSRVLHEQSVYWCCLASNDLQPAWHGEKNVTFVWISQIGV